MGLQLQWLISFLFHWTKGSMSYDSPYIMEAILPHNDLPISWAANFMKKHPSTYDVLWCPDSSTPPYQHRGSLHFEQRTNSLSSYYTCSHIEQHLLWLCSLSPNQRCVPSHAHLFFYLIFLNNCLGQFFSSHKSFTAFAANFHPALTFTWPYTISFLCCSNITCIEFNSYVDSILFYSILCLSF